MVTDIDEDIVIFAAKELDHASSQLMVKSRLEV